MFRKLARVLRTLRLNLGYRATVNRLYAPNVPNTSKRWGMGVIPRALIEEARLLMHAGNILFMAQADSYLDLSRTQTLEVDLGYYQPFNNRDSLRRSRRWYLTRKPDTLCLIVQKVVVLLARLYICTSLQTYLCKWDASCWKNRARSIL